MLVVGAGGGIATMAVALAVAAGVGITVTSSSPDTIERAVDAGASGGVLHSEAGWPEHARAMSPHNAGFDLVLDPVGRWSESVRTLRPGGRLVVLGANAAQTAPMDVRSFYFGQFDLLGTTMGSSRDFAGLLNMIDRCSVRPPVIDSEFPLDRADEAHEHLESGSMFGKCVLRHD
jgi:NADPH:quinone reductase-like Zn-dependent oxidoreductase